jgi:hypothetical protein
VVLVWGRSFADGDPELYDVSYLPPTALEALEADTFWCLSKLLDGIQDNYIFAQPGIQRQVARMKELCHRVDGTFPVLSLDFRSGRAQGLTALFGIISSSRYPSRGAKRRIHSVCISVDELVSARCSAPSRSGTLLTYDRFELSLLMREMSVNNIIRMWDTYLVRHRIRFLLLIRFKLRHPTNQPDSFGFVQAEGADAFSEYHLYVCLAFLVKWSEQLRSMDFQVSRPQPSGSDLSLSVGLNEADERIAGHHHVPPVFTVDAELDRDPDRAPPLRGLHVEESLSCLCSPFSPCRILPTERGSRCRPYRMHRATSRASSPLSSYVAAAGRPIPPCKGSFLRFQGGKTERTKQ